MFQLIPTVFQAIHTHSKIQYPWDCAGVCLKRHQLKAIICIVKQFRIERLTAIPNQSGSY